jgi:uncharacterized protein
MSTRSAYETLAPELSLSINGQPLPNKAAADLIGASVLEDVDAPGMFTFTLSGADTIEMKPKWVDDDLFKEGAEVEISIGYRDQTVKLFSGEATGLEPDFEEGMPPTLTVRGYDRCHRLTRARKTRSFTQCKDSDIASQVANDCGLRPSVVDSGVVLPYVLQQNQTDLEFLSARARRIGYEILARDRDLLFRPRPIDATPTLTLHREVELLSFHPKLSTLAQVSELNVYGWDPAKKQAIAAHAASADEPRLMAGSTSGPSATQTAFDAVAGVRVSTPVQSQDEADMLARRAFAEMALHFVHARGVCIGEPAMRAGTVVKIEGLGARFSGPYYVTGVEHVFGRKVGFRTHFTARRNAS